MPSTFHDTYLHLRPKSWPIVFAHFSGGAAIALGHAPELTWRMIVQYLAGGALWAIFLNGGTLAVNSAFDKDEEGADIGYLDAPPPTPPDLSRSSINLMVLGLAGAFALPWGYFWIYATCFLLSLIYSVPPLRLKAVPGADLAINMAGYGAFNFAAGAMVAGTGLLYPGLFSAVVWLAFGFAFLFGAFYPMTQIYQLADDMAKGDRTLVVRFGTRRVLAMSIAFIAASGFCQAMAAWACSMQMWGYLALLVSSGAWIVFTIDWLRRAEGYPNQKGMYRALKLWAISDLVVIFAFTFAA